MKTLTGHGLQGTQDLVSSGLPSVNGLSLSVGAGSESTVAGVIGADSRRSPSHTPGPWKDGPVFATEGRALFWNDTSKPGKWQRRVDGGGIFKAEDAARIVACVNRLAGIPTEDLNSIAILRDDEELAVTSVGRSPCGFNTPGCTLRHIAGPCQPLNAESDEYRAGYQDGFAEACRLVEVQVVPQRVCAHCETQIIPSNLTECPKCDKPVMP